MRDPTATVDPKVEAAIEDAVRFLSLPARLGVLDRRSPWEDLSPEERAELAEQANDLNDPLRFQTRITVTLLPDHVMPEHMRDYICRVLFEKGKVDRGNIDRDMWIVAAVDALVARGFHPEQSHHAKPSGQRGASACSIVQTALARLGVHRSGRTIEDIWGSRSSVPECPEKMD